jgi:membrane protease YdiL (CAAX protease family)
MLTAKSWTPESVLRLLAGVFASLGVVGILGHLSALFLTGLEKTTRELLLSFLGTIVLQIVSFILVHFFVKQNQSSWGEAFGFRGARWGRSLGLGALATVLAFPVSLGLMWVSQQVLDLLSIEPVSQRAVEILQTTPHLWQKVLLGFMALAMAPVWEELLFRGILYPSLLQAGFPRLALWGTSLVFGVSHFNLATFLPLSAFGVLLCLLYRNTGNLAAPMVTHCLFNTANFVWGLLEPASP